MPPLPDDLPAGSTRRDPTLLIGIAVLLLAARVIAGITDTSVQAPAASPFHVQGSFSTTRSTTPEAPPESGAATERVAWQPIAAATASQAGGRPILYDFTAAWCPPCRMLNKAVFSDPEAAAYINQHFLPVRVLDRAREEGQNPPEVDALQRRFQITAFPTLVMVSANGGQPIVLDGYAGREGTMAALQEAAEKLK
jgi:thiol:disulfide interchange protein